MTMMNKAITSFLIGGLTLSLCGCVNQHPNQTKQQCEGSTALEIARNEVESLDHEVRIVATSPAVVEICDRLNLDLVGVPNSNIQNLPQRYANSLRIGLAMSPDLELVSSLNPDWILGPSSLISDLQPKFESLNVEYAFLNLKSVDGLYTSMDELGEIFSKQEEAYAQRHAYESFMQEYNAAHTNAYNPTVLILMGLPGSYIIATENSYVGSLVEMAGGKNVYAGTNEEFLNVNTEDMKTKNPDIILRCAHAMPDDIVKMFDQDFKENDIWHHFDAVKQGHVYDLTYENFGMSAKFNYPDALYELDTVLYGRGL